MVIGSLRLCLNGKTAKGSDAFGMFPVQVESTSVGSWQILWTCMGMNTTLPSSTSRHASFRLFDSCQKRFLWANKEVDLAPRPVVGLVLQVGDTEKFPQALRLKSLDPFAQSQQVGFMSHGYGERR